MTAKEYLINIRRRRRKLDRNRELLKVTSDYAKRLDLAVEQAKMLIEDSNDFWTVFSIPAQHATLLYTVYFQRRPIKTIAREAGKDPTYLYRKHRSAIDSLDNYLNQREGTT